MNVSDVRPLIGITTYYQHATWGVWNGEAAILPGNYLHAVVDAGGIPVLLPPRGTGTKVLDTLDGLLVIGGSDVDPSRYGENAHPTTEFDTERDSHDFALLGAAEALGLPILCVCRGAQVLNVAHGGSLLQHLPDVLPEGEQYRCAPGVFSDTRITIDPESLAHSILGDSCTVSSYHHQGLDRIGKGLLVSARSADGLPQILESTDDSWLIATQYHPEEKRLEDRRLFAAFVAACGSRTEAVSDTKPTPQRGDHGMSIHEVINPATEEVIDSVEHLDVKGTDEAIERAARAYETWKNVAPAERARIMRDFASALGDAQEELARLEVSNAGHVIGNARWEAGNVRDVVGYYSAAPERLLGDQIPVDGGLNVTFHEPLGVVGVIVPWNFPMPIAGWAIGPALAAGNTVVLKPAELTPLTAMRIGSIAREAGVPEGVLQILPGKGSVVGDRFVTHPAVRKVVFTGSTAVGRRIMAGCASQSKRVTLEMGGKNSNVVFADADVRAAAEAAPGGAFDNAGQDCCARSRILVQESVFDEFMEHLETAVKNFRVGDPNDEESAMGPLISAAHRDSVLRYIDQGDVAFTGEAPSGPGYWVRPTVLLARSATEPCFSEEIFGPVVSVLRFRDEGEAVELANNTEYGLSGSIWTRDLGRALRVSRGIESGNLSVNSHSSVRYSTPFGGFKQSGLGRELGPHAVEAFTEVKNVFFANNQSTHPESRRQS